MIARDGSPRKQGSVTRSSSQILNSFCLCGHNRNETRNLNWCASRRLQLNASKTELIWFGSRANLSKLSSEHLVLQVGADNIQPAASVRDLGVHLDSELKMTMQSRLQGRQRLFLPVETLETSATAGRA